MSYIWSKLYCIMEISYAEAIVCSADKRSQKRLKVLPAGINYYF